MSNLVKWERELIGESRIYLSICILLLFFLFELILWKRLLSEEHFSKSIDYLEESENLPQTPLLEKALLYKKTLKLFQSSIALCSYDSRVYFHYAELMNKISRNKDLSVALGAEGLGAQKENSDIYYNVAKTNYIKAILLEPTNSISHLRLGTIYSAVGDDDSAEAEFKTAVLLDPQNMSIHLYLSKYFLSRNDNVSFLTHLNKTAELYNAIGPGVKFWEEVEAFFRLVGRQDLIRR